TIQADGTGAYTVTSSTLAQGSRSMTVKATDAAGNTSTSSDALTVTIDTSAPSQPVNAPDLLAADDSGSSSTDNITNVTTPHFPGPSGAVENSATVTLFDGSTNVGTIAANSSGAYTVQASTLSQGARTMTVTATDTAGNTSVASDPL